MTQGIQVKNLPHTTSLDNNASILALNNQQNNEVNLIDIPSFMESLKGIKSIPIVSLGEISGNVALEANNVYSATITGNTIFTPEALQTGQTTLNQILVQLKIPTAKTVQLGTQNGFFNQATVIDAAGIYNVFYEYDVLNNIWVVGSVYKGAVS